MSRLRDRALFALFCLFAPQAAFAGVSCTTDQTICLSSIANANGVDLWVENKRPGDLSFSLELSSENLNFDSAARDYSLTPGRHRILSAQLQQSGPWNLHYRFFALPGLATAKHDDTYDYSLPFAPEQSVRVSQGFHGKFSHNDTVNEYAVDFDVPEGTPLHAAREGKVVEVIQNFRAGGPSEPLENVNAIRIEHPDHTVAEYAHLRLDGAVVKVGQQIKKGELIGYSGNTGRTNGAHLHFAVHIPLNGKARRSVPIHFATDEGSATIPQAGKEYRRAAN